jgi:hypothetical protein
MGSNRQDGQVADAAVSPARNRARISERQANLVKLQTVGLDFLDTAPVRVHRTRVIRAPLPAVFEAVAGDPAGWARWCPGFTPASQWTSPPPHTVGSVRTMYAFGAVIVERVLRWNDDARWTFVIDETSKPAFDAFLEDWQFERVGGTSTRVTWSMAAEGESPNALMKARLQIQLTIMMFLAARRLEKLLRPSAA